MSVEKCQFLYATGERKCKNVGTLGEGLFWRNTKFTHLCKDHRSYISHELRYGQTGEVRVGDKSLNKKLYSLEPSINTIKKELEVLDKDKLKNLSSYIETETMELIGLGTFDEIIHRLDNFVDRTISGEDIINVRNAGKIIALQEIKEKFFPK